jgi:VanZ family protein
MKRTWLRYVLLIAWMAVIFQASHTPDLRAVPWVERFGLLPAGLEPATVGLIEFILRKGAHMITFGALAMLAYWALVGSFPRSARIRIAGGAFLMAVAYAATDEWHQTFVPTRMGSVVDVGIDSAGAILALLLVHRWWGR